MRVFKAMREYISQNKQLLPYQEILRLSAKSKLLLKEIIYNIIGIYNMTSKPALEWQDDDEFVRRC